MYPIYRKTSEGQLWKITGPRSFIRVWIRTQFSQCVIGRNMLQISDALNPDKSIESNRKDFEEALHKYQQEFLIHQIKH